MKRNSILKIFFFFFYMFVATGANAEPNLQILSEPVDEKECFFIDTLYARTLAEAKGKALYFWSNAVLPVKSDNRRFAEVEAFHCKSGPSIESFVMDAKFDLKTDTISLGFGGFWPIGEEAIADSFENGVAISLQWHRFFGPNHGFHVLINEQGDYSGSYYSSSPTENNYEGYYLGYSYRFANSETRHMIYDFSVGWSQSTFENFQGDQYGSALALQQSLSWERKMSRPKPYYDPTPDFYMGLKLSHSYWPNSTIRGVDISGHGVSLMFVGSIRFWRGIPVSKRRPDYVDEFELD